MVQAEDCGYFRQMTKNFPPIVLGPLAVDMINRTIGTELQPGLARLSSRAHRHAQIDHPEDYALCMRFIEAVVIEPSVIGQAPKHGRNFELLRRIPGQDGDATLVAIKMEPDERGDYRVVSFYKVTARELHNKRGKGHILPTVK
jgi:hypothetical protein